MPYYYFDWTYVVLVLPCVLLSLWDRYKLLRILPVPDNSTS